MRVRHGEAKWVVGKVPGVQAAHVEGMCGVVEGDRNVGPRVADAFQSPVGVAFGELELCAWMASLERTCCDGQQVCARSGERCDSHRRLDTGLEAVDLTVGGLGGLEDAECVPQGDVTSRRQSGAGYGSVDQLSTEFTFEGRHVLRNGRLGQVERISRSGERAETRNLTKYPQALEALHRHGS